MNQFSPEEQEIIKSFEAGEWISQGTPERFKQLQLYANNIDKFDQQVTLNLSDEDLTSLKAEAKEKSISFDKLLSSILHKYITGKLIEK